MLETFKSKEVELKSPSYAVFASLSDLRLIKDRLPEEYREKVAVTQDTIEGDYQGMHLGMRVTERIPTSRIVMKPMEGFPMDFTLLLDVVDTSASTSNFQVSIQAQMNFIMKAMLGRKIQSVLDEITDKIAQQSV